MDPIGVGGIIAEIEYVLELIERRDPEKTDAALQEAYSVLKRCRKDIKALRPPFKLIPSFMMCRPGDQNV